MGREFPPSSPEPLISEGERPINVESAFRKRVCLLGADEACLLDTRGTVSGNHISRFSTCGRGLTQNWLGCNDRFQKVHTPLAIRCTSISSSHP